MDDIFRRMQNALDEWLATQRNKEIDPVARDRLNGEIKNLDKLKMTDRDKKTALLLVYSINPMEFFSFREAALLLGKCPNSIAKIMTHHPDGHFSGLNIGK